MSATVSAPRHRRLLLASGAVIAAVAATIFIVSVGSPRQDDGGAVADFAFVDDAGNVLHLSDFRGRTILLNLWATWCVPCRVEMPKLDHLQAELGGPNFQLVAVALDRGGMPIVQRFLGDTGILNLAAYVAEPGEVMSRLGVVGLPTTLLIDPNGLERFRVVGPADWDGPEMVARVREQLPERGSAANGGPP
ncbi:MAG: TlpA family protein disulfide reductase [Bauldia sp.]